MLFVQEPWIIDQRSINHSGFQQIAPRTTLRPRTTTWIRKDIQAKVVPGDEFQDDPDIQIFDVLEGGDATQFVHVYNERNRSENTPNWALERILQQVTTSGHNSRLQKSVVLLGDLNLHHESWDPGCTNVSQLSVRFREWLDQHDFTLGNTIGVGTFFRPHMSKASVLDLVFTRGEAASRFQDWQTLPPFGSDHLGVLFTLAPREGPQTSTLGGYNTRNADWEKFTTLLKAKTKELDPILSAIACKPARERILDADCDGERALDFLALRFTQLIQQTAKETIPRIKIAPQPKPWWSKELTTLRKGMGASQRAFQSQRTPDLLRELKNAKNQYFQAIKIAKSTHWNAFLGQSDPKTTFRAMSYTKERKKELIPSIVGPPPEDTTLGVTTLTPELRTNTIQSSFRGQCHAFVCFVHLHPL